MLLLSGRRLKGRTNSPNQHEAWSESRTVSRILLDAPPNRVIPSGALFPRSQAEQELGELLLAAQEAQLETRQQLEDENASARRTQREVRCRSDSLAGCGAGRHRVLLRLRGRAKHLGVLLASRLPCSPSAIPRGSRGLQVQELRARILADERENGLRKMLHFRLRTQLMVD